MQGPLDLRLLATFVRAAHSGTLSATAVQVGRTQSAVTMQIQRLEEALPELREAARLDPAYAEPHMAMARILHKLGREAPAREEVQTYLRLHPHSTP